MRGSHFVAFFVALCTYFILGIDATCYYPNGTAAFSGDQFPCNAASGVESMCCSTSYQGNMSEPDRCTKDGLCDSSNNYGVSRATCTDPTWKDPACLNLCTSGRGKIPQQWSSIKIVRN